MATAKNSPAAAGNSKLKQFLVRNDTECSDGANDFMGMN